jgi:hypothetical protein
MAKSVSKVGIVKPKRVRKSKTIGDLMEDIKSRCLSIKSVIDSGNWEKLKDIEPLVSKAMADEMGVNHGRFSDKLRNPIKFSAYEIYRFALYVGADPDKLLKQLNHEVLTNKKLLDELKQFKSVQNLKRYSNLKK